MHADGSSRGGVARPQQRRARDPLLEYRQILVLTRGGHNRLAPEDTWIGSDSCGGKALARDPSPAHTLPRIQDLTGRMVGDTGDLERELLEVHGEIDGGDRHLGANLQTHRGETQQAENPGADHLIRHRLS